MRCGLWYAGGDTEYPMPGTDMAFKVSAQTAEFLRETRDPGPASPSFELTSHSRL